MPSAAFETVPFDRAPTGVELLVVQDIARRQAHGVRKYGTTVAGNPLPLRAWLQHAYEEALDLAVYLRRSIAEIDTRAQDTPFPGNLTVAGAAELAHKDYDREIEPED